MVSSMCIYREATRYEEVIQGDEETQQHKGFSLSGLLVDHSLNETE